MNDDQKDITEEQRLQQAQNAGTSSTAPAGGQASFSADYSATQQAQDSEVQETASEDTPSEQGGLVGDSNEAVTDNSVEVPTEASEEDDSAAVMNDFTEDAVEDIEVGDEEVEETEEPAEEEVVEEEVTSEEEPAQSLPGSVVGPDGQTGIVADTSIAGSDQQGATDASTDVDSGDIPAPDLTPETDATSVDAAIDGAFADYNGGDSDTGGVLGGGADD